MSTAVAVMKNGVVALGTDRMTVFYGAESHASSNYRAVKARRVGGAVLAWAGWSVYDNLLEDYLSRNKHARFGSRLATFRFFLDFYKALIAQYHLVQPSADTANEPFGHLDSDFLVATSKRILLVQGNMRVSEFKKYAAIGSGSAYSLGALRAIYTDYEDAEALVRKAIDVASDLDVKSGGGAAIYVAGRA